MVEFFNGAWPSIVAVAGMWTLAKILLTAIKGKYFFEAHFKAGPLEMGISGGTSKAEKNATESQK